MAGQRSLGRLRRACGPKRTAAGTAAGRGAAKAGGPKCMIVGRVASTKVAGRKRTAAAAKAAGKSEYLFSCLVFSLCVQFICKVNNL